MKQGFHLILGIKARWQFLQDEVSVKLPCALVACFVEKQHLEVEIFTNIFDGLITAPINDEMQFLFQVSYIIKQLIFFAMVVTVVKADEPPGIDAVELIADEAFDIPLQTLGLLSLFLLY